jgi:hypothetical protein
MFEEKTYSFNKKLLMMVLFFQYIPFIVLIFTEYNAYYDAITIVT